MSLISFDILCIKVVHTALVNALLVKILNDTASWDKASAEIISPKISWAIFYGVAHVLQYFWGSCVNAKRMVQWIHSLSWILFLKIMRFFSSYFAFCPIYTLQAMSANLWNNIASRCIRITSLKNQL